MSLKIVFAGTPEFAADILNALIHSEHQILAVLTQCDKPKGRGQKLSESAVKVLAEKNQYPILQVKTLKNREIQQTLKAMDPDLMIVVAYGLILPKEILNIPKYGCINVHASLLPRFRGASPIQHAILAGDPLTGITLMQMDEGLDTGDILAVYPCTIEMHETTQSLSQRLARIGAELLINTLPLIENETLSKQTQEESHASYAHKINKEDAVIDWTKEAKEIDRLIRAFNPWPIAETFMVDESSNKDMRNEIRNEIPNEIRNDMHHNIRLRIFAATINEPILDGTALSHLSNPKPGTIIEANEKGILVACGVGQLYLTELQIPGGKRLNAKALLNSKKDWFLPGKKLGG